MAEKIRSKRLKFRDWSVRRKAVWWALVVALISIFVWVEIDAHYRYQNWVTTTGIVTDLGLWRDRDDGSSSRDITVEFEVDGELFSFSRSVDNNTRRGNLRIGDQYPLHYNPANPNQARLGRAEAFGFTIIGFAWSVVVCGGMLLLAFYLFGIIGVKSHRLNVT